MRFTIVVQDFTARELRVAEVQNVKILVIKPFYSVHRIYYKQTYKSNVKAVKEIMGHNVKSTRIDIIFMVAKYSVVGKPLNLYVNEGIRVCRTELRCGPFSLPIPPEKQRID